MPESKDIICKATRLCDIPEVPFVHDWANQHRMMTSEVTAKAGMYDVEVTPYMREPGEAVDDPSVSMLVLQLASRLGKTENCLLNPIGRSIHLDPFNWLIVYPTLSAAEKFSKEMFSPMIEASHVLDDLVRPTGKGSTMLSKTFPGGRVSMIGANSPSAFRQIQARGVAFDEIDAMENSREGDPITLGLKRADNYADAIQILLSTPTIKHLSRIESWLLKSDYRQYFIPSPFTGNYHVMAWKNMVIKDGNRRMFEDAYYADPETGDPWTEEHRRDAIHAGEWRPTQEFNGIRGYQANGMISLFSQKKGFKSKYHQFSHEFFEAKDKGSEALQTWTNTFLSETWEDQAAQEIDGTQVMNRIENYDTSPIPDVCLMVTFAADVQRDRIEFEWVAWLDDFESYGLMYGVIAGDTRRKAIWNKLNEELRRVWKHESGGELRMLRGFIDEGDNAEMVRKFCLGNLSQGIELYPCKGIGKAGLNEPELVAFNAQKRQKGIKAPTWNVGVNRAKRAIFNHMLIDPPGANTMHWTEKAGSGYDSNYFSMLTAEKEVRKFSMGQEYRAFVKSSSGARNEALDIRAYGYACAVSLNPNWDGLRKMVARKLPKEKVIEAKEPKEEKTDFVTMQKRPAKRTRRKGGGFVNRY